MADGLANEANKANEAEFYLADWTGVASCTFPFRRTAGGCSNLEVWRRRYAPSPPGPHGPGSCGRIQTGGGQEGMCQNGILPDGYTLYMNNVVIFFM